MSTVDYTVTTVAGNGVGGAYVDGVGAEARIGAVKRMQFTPNGTVLIFVDTECVRALDLLTLRVQTLVGICGYAYTPDHGGAPNGPPASSVNIYGVSDALLHEDGVRLFLLNGGYSWIRVLNLTSGIVTDAGAGQYGTNACAEGVGVSLNQPFGFAAMERDIILIAGLNSIKRWDLISGNITDFAGVCGTGGTANGVGTSARLTLTVDRAFVASSDRKWMFTHDAGLSTVIRRISYPGAVVSKVSFGVNARDRFFAFSPDNTVVYTSTNSGGRLPGGYNVRMKIMGSGNLPHIVAGGSVKAYVDGVGTLAKFWNPMALSTYGGAVCGPVGNETCPTLCGAGLFRNSSMAECIPCPMGTYWTTTTVEAVVGANKNAWEVVSVCIRCKNAHRC